MAKRNPVKEWQHVGEAEQHGDGWQPPRIPMVRTIQPRPITNKRPAVKSKQKANKKPVGVEAWVQYGNDGIIAVGTATRRY